MTRRLVAVALLTIAGCAPRPDSTESPAVPLAPTNRSEATFVAVGNTAAVLDSVEADLATREHLALRRGVDLAGVATLTVLDTFPGQVNEAVLRIVAAGGGRSWRISAEQGASTARLLC